MIDQTTLGHKFLMDELGAAPRNPGYQEDALIVFPSLCRRFVLVHSLGMRTGWQLDPFGHSATQAALLSAEVGFQGLFFGRIDYQERDAAALSLSLSSLLSLLLLSLLLLSLSLLLPSLFLSLSLSRSLSPSLPPSLPPSLSLSLSLPLALSLSLSLALSPFLPRLSNQSKQEDLELRREKKEAEFIWRASPSLGSDAQVFTGLTGSFLLPCFEARLSRDVTEGSPGQASMEETMARQLVSTGMSPARTRQSRTTQTYTMTYIWIVEFDSES